MQDATGAVIAGAKVSIANTGTGIVRDTVTNDVGLYRFVAVEPGAYNIEFSKDGFETVRVANISVGQNQEITINRTLAVGTITSAVEVQEAPPGVELAKTTATVERKLDQSIVEKLPTTGATRDVSRLMLLAPTAVRVTGQGGGITVNGQRPRNNNYTIDGVDNNDVSIATQAARIIPEQVGEFQVLANAYSAEFGRNSGGQMSVTTRAGTNSLHGEVFDYFAAHWMEPLSLPQKRSGVTERPRYNHNQAGAAVGGPVIRNRTFFFGLLETNRRREAPNPDNASNINVPTPQGYAMLANLPLGPGQTQASRQAALNSLGFLSDYYPVIGNSFTNLTNVNINGTQVPFGSARVPIAYNPNYWYVVARVDHMLTNSDYLSYRNNIDKRIDPLVASNLGFGPRWAADQAILAQSHSLSETHTFGPSLINEFRFAYGRRNLTFPEQDPISPTVGITGAFTVGGGSTFPQGRIQNTFQYQDVLTWQVGKHALKFGADYRRVRFYNIQGFDTKGTWVFDNFADFMNGRASQFRIALSTATVDMRQNLFGGFFQDDFKITPTLTLNLGARWDYSSYPNGLFGATDPQIRAALVNGPVQEDKNNWAPRFGFAWSPAPKDGLLNTLFGDGRTVFRGGYGISYDLVFLNLVTNVASNYPRVVNALTTPPESYNLYPDQRVGQAAGFNPLGSFVVMPEDTQNPTNHFYSFSIQRQFAKDYIFELGYTGNRGYHLIRQNQWNFPIVTPEQAQRVIETRSTGTAVLPSLQNRRLYPQYGSRTSVEATGTSNYNAMYLKFDKRLSRNFLVGANYTWSKLLSDSDESLVVSGLSDSTPSVPQDYRNRKNEWAVSAFDRPHRFVMHWDAEVPYFTQGVMAHKVLRYALKGWSVSGKSEWQSGQPFTILTGADSSSLGRSDASRPDYNPSGTLTTDPVYGNYRTFVSPVVGGKFVTPLGTTGLPLAYTMPYGGNLGRNTFRGPSFTQWDLNLSKTFQVNERFRFRLRADAINLFNHRNFGPPNNNMSSPSFGQNTRDQVGTFGRQMLLSAKVFF